MPLQDVQLVPGINSQMTLAQNQAGISISNLVRYKDGLVQKGGGWELFYPYSISSTPIRDIHAFQALRNEAKWLGLASPSRLVVISSAKMLTDITPQYLQTNPVPSFSVSSGSNVVTVVDPGSSAADFSSVRFDTPIALAGTGILLNGAYPIASVIGVNSYTINAATTAAAALSSGGTVPKFYCSSGSGSIGVILSYNNFIKVTGLYYPFRAASSVGGITIQGGYQLSSIIDSTNFIMQSPELTTSAVSSATPVSMNSSLASLYYYITGGPPPIAGAYGVGLYGANLYGVGTLSTGGTSLVATDYMLDNWGEELVAFQENGAIYVWSPDLGYQQAQAITAGGAPLFNIGGFVSLPNQIMMAFGSTQSTGQQDQLTINWSDSGAQAGYGQWVASTNNFAGSFKIPTGSTLMGGIQAPLYAIFWTDVDVWTATWIGQPLVWSFLQTGTGCGLIGKHACCVNNGVVYWASQNNFWTLGPNGLQVLTCTVWDFFFQQLDITNQHKVRCASNSAFNELIWYFPVIGGSGENQAYVKLHIENEEIEWDYGYLDRTSWMDISTFGMPMGTDSNGYLYQHETSNDAAGTALQSSIETGYFVIGDGTQLAFIDWVLPDMKWGFQGGTAPSATVQFTFFTTDYTGQSERVYGPFAVTQTVPYISCRMRGRFWRMRVQSNDVGTWWRLGKTKFRWAPSGAR